MRDFNPLLNIQQYNDSNGKGLTVDTPYGLQQLNNYLEEERLKPWHLSSKEGALL